MSQSNDPITYLPLPDSLQAAVEEAISVTSKTVDSHSEKWTSNFDLPKNEGVELVVEEAKKAYRKEKFPSEIWFLSSHGAVFKGTWKSGGSNDTVIVPLIDYHTEVTAGETKFDWHWGKAIFVPRLTIFKIEEGHKIGAILIQFKR